MQQAEKDRDGRGLSEREISTLVEFQGNLADSEGYPKPVNSSLAQNR